MHDLGSHLEHRRRPVAVGTSGAGGCELFAIRLKDGGRWRVVQAWGITTQLTNAADVVDAASALTDTGVRFVCPLCA